MAMKNKTSKKLINSLVGRLIKNGDSFRLPEGVLSADEVAALYDLVGRSFQPALDAVIPATPNLAGLDLSAAGEKRGPNEADLRICLDFGTAMSKAWATGSTVADTLPLVLGGDAKNGGKLVVPSSIYIGQNQHIYLGADADRMFRQELKPGRLKFENLKRMLSEAEVDSDLYSLPLRLGIDPCDSGLHQGDLLVLYLAWLTDQTLLALNRSVSGLDLPGLRGAELRLVRRRFAIPCFEHAVDEEVGGRERAQWAFKSMSDAILRAQIVADTLTGQWRQLTVDKAVEVLEQVRGVNIELLKHLLTTEPSIREPIAAGASRFSGELDGIGVRRSEDRAVRRFLMVVDAGAGTTDFAVFQVIDRGTQDDLEYVLIKPSVRMSRIAGNAIDELLRPMVMSACNIDANTGHPRSKGDFEYIQMDLTAQIRDIKRELFEKGAVKVNIKPNAKGVLNIKDVLDEKTYREHEKDLLQTRDESLRSIFDPVAMESYKLRSERFGKPIPIHLLLTGGSATLPVIRGLAEGEVVIGGARFAFTLVDHLPKWVSSLPREAASLVEGVYAQAAVAIGGSAPDLPTESQDRITTIDPPLPGERVLSSYQVTGVG